MVQNKNIKMLFVFVLSTSFIFVISCTWYLSKYKNIENWEYHWVQWRRIMKLWIDDKNKKALAVIFTTFKNNPEKFHVYENTITNWGYFYPIIQPILFSTEVNETLISLAKANNWIIHPCPRVNLHGTPFLQDMYNSSYQLINASFYAFTNGDILFGSDLLKTLSAIYNDYKLISPMILSGRRWNHNFIHKANYSNPNDIIGLASSKSSEIYRQDAEDYFFVTKDFPWYSIKDVVIGRPGYDNYLIGRSIELNVTSIDGTETISAVHQTTQDGNHAGFMNKDKDFNYKTIGSFNYNKGFTGRMHFYTLYDFKKSVFIKNRTSQWRIFPQ